MEETKQNAKGSPEVDDIYFDLMQVQKDLFNDKEDSAPESLMNLNVPESAPLS